MSTEDRAAELRPWKDRVALSLDRIQEIVDKARTHLDTGEQMSLSYQMVLLGLAAHTTTEQTYQWKCEQERQEFENERGS